MVYATVLRGSSKDVMNRLKHYDPLLFEEQKRRAVEMQRAAKGVKHGKDTTH